MGMFDYIRVKMPLPADPKPPQGGIFFQTKDTPSQFLDKYTIETDGSLIEHAVRFEDRSNPNAKGMLRTVGHATAIPDPENDRTLPFHGIIRFHHYDNKTEEWWEYAASFTNSKCTKIYCLEHRKSK